MIAPVQDLLSFHAFGHPGIKIVWDVIELDYSAHHGLGILGSVEYTGN
jgi:hypothetical protein